MFSVNKVILVGVIASEIELRHTTSSVPVCNFSVVTSRTFQKRNGEKGEGKEWHKITVFGKNAETIAESGKKGEVVYVEGRITTDKWTDKEGLVHRTTKIVSREAELGGHNGHA